MRTVAHILRWWAFWSAATAFGYGAGALASWAVERQIFALLESQTRSTTLEDVWQSVAASSLLFGAIIATAQFPLLRTLLPRLPAWRWMIATMFGWIVDGVMQWFRVGPVCWLMIWLWISLSVWLLQVRMLQPGMPKAGAWYWLIATTATRWLVNSPLFDGVRDIFAVTGGPLAMAGMGATLGLIYGGVTGVALLLLAPPTALPQAEPPLNAPSPAAPTPPPP